MKILKSWVENQEKGSQKGLGTLECCREGEGPQEVGGGKMELIEGKNNNG